MTDQKFPLPVRAVAIDLDGTMLDTIEDLGVADALTGPVARGDWETVARHRGDIDPSELALYDALVEAARRVVDSRTGGADAAQPTNPRTES